MSMKIKNLFLHATIMKLNDERKSYYDREKYKVFI